MYDESDRNYNPPLGDVVLLLISLAGVIMNFAVQGFANKHPEYNDENAITFIQFYLSVFRKPSLSFLFVSYVTGAVLCVFGSGLLALRCSARFFRRQHRCLLFCYGVSLLFTPYRVELWTVLLFGACISTLICVWRSERSRNRDGMQ